MAGRGLSRFGAEYDKIERGGLASSTEQRLRELTGWGGSTSSFSARALDVAADAGVDPVCQVVGLSAGVIRSGYLRTTRPGQGRKRIGAPRWLEHSGPSMSWAMLRRRAVARLVRQAEIVGADAVVGVKVERRAKPTLDEWAGGAEVCLSGTAVRVDGWRSRGRPPVVALVSIPELWAMLRAGVEPVGIAGGFASVEALPSISTVVATRGRRRRTPSMELEDLTKCVYEARRLALQRLVADAGALRADGLIGIDLKIVDDGHAGWRWRSTLGVTVDVLASAIRRVGTASVGTEPVVSMSGPGA